MVAIFNSEPRGPVAGHPSVIGASVVGLAACTLWSAPAVGAYASWCDLFETHAPRIVLISEPLRTNPGGADVGRLNSFYGNVIPQLDTVALATFWFPNSYGSPDIRPEMQNLVDAMRDLQDGANRGEPTHARVQAVDDAIGVLHQKCAGRRGLPDTWPDRDDGASAGG